MRFSFFEMSEIFDILHILRHKWTALNFFCICQFRICCRLDPEGRIPEVGIEHVEVLGLGFGEEPEPR